MAGSSTSTVGLTLLDAVEFPTDRDALLTQALTLDLPSAVCDAIRRLRTGTFHSRSDLVTAIEALS